MTEKHEYLLTIFEETPLSVRVENLNIKMVWLPKSQIEIDGFGANCIGYLFSGDLAGEDWEALPVDKEISIPQWLAKEKELI